MTRTILIVLVVAAGGTAAAQPDPTPTPTPVAPDPVAPEPDPVPVVTPPAETPHSTGERYRPIGYAIAIGVGYDLPADLQAPNTTSVRFRLPSGITFEPTIAIGRSSSTTMIGMNETESKDLELSLVTLVRLPMRIHRRVDFELLGAAGVSIVSDLPNGADNDSRTTTVAASWGLGLAYWITPHWQLSLSALNPIIVYSNQTTEVGPDMENETSSMTIAAIFDPNVLLMAHLYW